MQVKSKTQIGRSSSYPWHQEEEEEEEEEEPASKQARESCSGITRNMNYTENLIVVVVLEKSDVSLSNNNNNVDLR